MATQTEDCRRRQRQGAGLISRTARSPPVQGCSGSAKQVQARGRRRARPTAIAPSSNPVVDPGPVLPEGVSYKHPDTSRRVRRLSSVNEPFTIMQRHDTVASMGKQGLGERQQYDGDQP